MLALVDADILVYRCGFAVEKTLYTVYKTDCNIPVAVFEGKRQIPSEYFDEKFFVIEADKKVEPLENALHATKELIESILAATEATSYELYLSGKDNFREKIAVTRPYKGNRDPSHKPKWFNEIRQYLIDRWGAVVVDGMEADDAIAISHTAHYKNRISREPVPIVSSVICTIDKDLDQVPGLHYNFTTRELYVVSEEEATRNFYVQLLMGDRVDNIQGIIGIGLKTANKILEKCSDELAMYAKVRDAYWLAYGKVDSNYPQEIMREMADLLWIRRTSESRWEPPT